MRRRIDSGSTDLSVIDGPLRVLLYAPLEGIDPSSGDTTYTKTLVENPPSAVHYTTYAEALADGRLRSRGRRGDLHTGVDVLIAAARAAELGLRRRWLFREQTRFITAEPDSFDLIHNHIFALRQIGTRVPTVSSAGYPLSELYRSREGWTPTRAARADT